MLISNNVQQNRLRHSSYRDAYVSMHQRALVRQFAELRLFVIVHKRIEMRIAYRLS